METIICGIFESDFLLWRIRSWTSGAVWVWFGVVFPSHFHTANRSIYQRKRKYWSIFACHINAFAYQKHTAWVRFYVKHQQKTRHSQSRKKFGTLSSKYIQSSLKIHSICFSVSFSHSFSPRYRPMNEKRMSIKVRELQNDHKMKMTFGARFKIATTKTFDESRMMAINKKHRSFFLSFNFHATSKAILPKIDIKVRPYGEEREEMGHTNFYFDYILNVTKIKE